MSRRKKNKKKNRGNPTSSQNGGHSTQPKSNPGKVTASPEVVELQKLSDAAFADATEADLQEVEKRPEPAPDASPEKLVKLGQEALALLEIQRDRAAQAEEEAKALQEKLDTERNELEKQRAGLEKEREEFEERTRSLETTKKAVEKTERELVKREEALVKRELDADAGFIQRNRDSLQELDKEAERIREEFSARRIQISQERDAWEAELQKKRSALAQETDARRERFEAELARQQSEWEEKLEERQRALDERESQLSAEATRLRKEGRSMAAAQELLEEDKAAVSEKAEQIAAADIEQRDAQLAAVEERLQAARKDRDELARVLAEREEADTRFGNRTPDEVLREMRALKKEKTKLEKALGERPGADALQRLDELAEERDAWQAERLSLIEEVARSRQELQSKRIAVTELEGLRNHKAALEASNELLEKALEEELRKVNDMVRGADGASPFPSCSKMDENTVLQSSRPTASGRFSLKAFADYVRHRMARDPDTGKVLYYSEEDVRSFIAGLAMSRLHLLQGISGTGKTSLPLAFARAIGAGQALIEIQAGWRDRQDLIGHFNAFEGRFHESEFLQELYRAGCPHYKDTPFIIVLDEMNLSHPEQYFADLLSALEQDQQRQRLVLMDKECDPAPRLLSGGKFLPIPPNVWFVGTANHDETTKDFADKTYDRAHVMELPRHREVFTIDDKQPMNPLDVNALLNSFTAAVDKHEKKADKAYTFLEEKLAEPLGRRFAVGWGNRLERQMEDYVPVVLECGGSIGEATDHILATKLLRKIRDRHDNRPEDIIELRERIQTEWKGLDKAHEAKKSLAILQTELHRLGHDED